MGKAGSTAGKDQAADVITDQPAAPTAMVLPPPVSETNAAELGSGLSSAAIRTGLLAKLTMLPKFKASVFYQPEGEPALPPHHRAAAPLPADRHLRTRQALACPVVLSVPVRVLFDGA